MFLEGPGSLQQVCSIFVLPYKFLTQSGKKSRAMPVNKTTCVSENQLVALLLEMQEKLSTFGCQWHR